MLLLDNLVHQSALSAHLNELDVCQQLGRQLNGLIEPVLSSIGHVHHVKDLGLWCTDTEGRQVRPKSLLKSFAVSEQDLPTMRAYRNICANLAKIADRSREQLLDNAWQTAGRSLANAARNPFNKGIVAL